MRMHGRNANPSRQEYGGTREVLMQREGAARAADLEHRAIRSCVQCRFEAGLAHTHGNHNRPFLLRGTRQRESPLVVASLIAIARVQKGEVGVLPRAEFVLGAVGIKPESHRASGDFPAAYQTHLRIGHKVTCAGVVFYRFFAPRLSLL